MYNDKRSFSLLAVVFLLHVSSTFSLMPFEDTSLPWNKRVDDFVGRLTLDEVIEQSVALYQHGTPTIDRLGVKSYQWITECLRGYTSHNATAFPQALGLSATFSTSLVYNVSVAISREVRAFYNDDIRHAKYGVNGLSCFDPVVNIARHPLWGRIQETYGEDPYLSGQLSRQYVYGLQGNHPRYLRTNAGCKHFDVHNGPENIPVSRFSFDAKVSERDMRMTYLPQFKACVQAGSYNVMCSYNRINGTPSCANRGLLTDLLRKEWGFRGFVISDAGAIENIVTEHKYNSTPEDAAISAVSAGCNMELQSGTPYYYAIGRAVLDGKLSEAAVRENLKPIMYTRFRLGEFDPPKMNPYSEITMSEVLSNDHQQLAVKAALKTFVLLKNLNGILPMKKSIERLAIVGPMADKALFGDYFPTPDSRYVSTPLQGLKKLATETRHANGCDDARCNSYNATQVKKAVVDAQLVIVCLGTGRLLEAEANDRSSLDLPGSQLQLLQDAAYYSGDAPLVLLLFNAGPLDVTWAKESSEVDAIVACFFPAQATGQALYDMVTASSPEAIPAGRLPVTWPAQLHQVPPITDYNMDGHTYRYYHGDPLYPFGYGLSYSQFRYTSLSVKPTQIAPGQNVSVTVSVINEGPLDADEVVQIYMSWTNASVPVPKLQLSGFQRQLLKVKVTATFTFVITSEQLAVWISNAEGFRVELGAVIIYSGGQQPYQRTNVNSNILKTSFLIKK